MELRTERLLLRPVTEDDVDAMLVVRNAPAVIGTTHTKEPLPRERMAGQVGRRVASWRERDFGSWLILRDGEPIGFVEVHPIGEDSGVDPDELELGVVLHPDQWGQGIALEAGAAAAATCSSVSAASASTPRLRRRTTSRSACSRRSLASVISAASSTSSTAPR